MTTSAQIGYGTLFQTESLDSPNDWRTVAEVNAITPPQVSRDMIDVTHEHGPNEWRGALTGMKSAGEVGLSFNFILGGPFEDLLAEMGDQTVRARRIVFPDGNIWPFDAYLKELSPATAVGDVMSCSAKFQVVGQPGAIEGGVPYVTEEPDVESFTFLVDGD